LSSARERGAWSSAGRTWLRSNGDHGSARHPRAAETWL